MIVYIIYVLSGINLMIVSGTKPIVSLYASKLGATPAEIGILASSFAVLPMFLAIHIGKWIDSYGIRRLLALGCSGLFLSLLVPVVYPHFFTLVFSQALMGVAFTLQVVALQKRIGATDQLEKRIATFSLAGSIGSMIGPSLSGFLYDHLNFTVSYCVNASFLLVSLSLIWLISPRDNWEVPTGESKLEDLDGRAGGSVWNMLKQRDLRNAIVISGLMLSNREIFTAYFPLLGERMMLRPTEIGLILSLMGAASMAIRMSQPMLVRRFGRMNVLTWALYISGIIYLLTPSIMITIVLTILIGILGAGLGVGQPLSLSYTIQVSPPERRGEVLGLRITFNRMSQFFVPLVFGSIGGIAGVTAIFWASGLLLLFGGMMTRAKPAASASVADKSEGA